MTQHVYDEIDAIVQRAFARAAADMQPRRNWRLWRIRAGGLVTVLLLSALMALVVVDAMDGI